MGKPFITTQIVTYEVMTTNGERVLIQHTPEDSTAIIKLIAMNGEVIGQMEFDVRPNRTASAIGEMFDAVDTAQLIYEDGVDN